MSVDHDYYASCDRRDCGGGCNLCTLAVCKVCGLLEGALTTDCPGVDCWNERNEDVYAGRIDFVDGAWVEQCSWYSPAAYSEKTLLAVTIPRLAPARLLQEAS
jgi:hypothetical protein